MRVITLNANGIRAAARKAFFDWFAKQDADVLCLQETKAKLAQLQDPCFRPAGYHAFFADAEKPGYSGVALYTRIAPKRAQWGVGDSHFDSEGRWVEVDLGGVRVVSVYLPSGSSSQARQDYKFSVLDWLGPKLEKLAQSGDEYLLCGDINIAHREIDLKNWRGNRKNSGFLPAERAWLDALFDQRGWADVFRSLDPREGQYTWWSNRGRAWDNNTGWRIDYHLATPKLAATARDPVIYKDTRFSDHAPLTIDYDWETA